MNEIENLEGVRGQTNPPGAHSNGNNVPASIGVYDRPEPKRPSLWLFVFMAILFLIAAVIVFQLVF